MQSRWLPALTSLRYRTGNLDVYLEELVSGLCHGLGASQVILGQYSEPETYHFITSSELHPGELENPDGLLALVEDIVEQKAPGLGVYTLKQGLAVAYCGEVLETSQGDYCGILLVLRPAIELFQVNDQQVLTLIAKQAGMAMELEKCYYTIPSAIVYPMPMVQNKLVAANQQLHQKLGQYRVELQHVSVQLQMERIAHSSLAKKFHKIFERSNDAILIIDPAQDKILEANPQATKLLNYSRHELLNCIKFSQLYPDKIPQLEKFIQIAFQKGQVWTNELTCLTKAKNKLPTEIAAVPIEVDGRPCILTIVQDISERTRLDAERKQSEMKAQHDISHLAEMEKLTSMIIHEIRNPLTTVLMGLASFKELHLDNRFASRLDIALAEAERLKRLLNEILLFSKSQSLDCEPLDLSQWSGDLLDDIKSHPSAVDRVIKLTKNPISAIVSADSEKLKQVFINLITNACEAVMAGEIITWDITRPSKSDHLTVRINNRGKPIPPSVLEKMTTPFFTTKSNGNGLGLAIVKRIIDAHQGQLSITSNTKDGTTVIITLPVLH